MKRFFRVLPWIIAGVATVGVGATYVELQRVRANFGEATRHTYHDHRDTRQFIIKAELADVDRPIVVLGDSVTEMARLPETIDDHAVINAGVGGATAADIQYLAPILLNDVKPTMIVVELGWNDVGSPDATKGYAVLFARLKKFSSNLLCVISNVPKATADQIRDAARKEGIDIVDIPTPPETRFDGIHMNAQGYRIWTPRLVDAISRKLS